MHRKQSKTFSQKNWKYLPNKKGEQISWLVYFHALFVEREKTWVLHIQIFTSIYVVVIRVCAEIDYYFFSRLNHNDQVRSYTNTDLNLVVMLCMPWMRLYVRYIYFGVSVIISSPLTLVFGRCCYCCCECVPAPTQNVVFFTLFHKNVNTRRDGCENVKATEHHIVVYACSLYIRRNLMSNAKTAAWSLCIGCCFVRL